MAELSEIFVCLINIALAFLYCYFWSTISVPEKTWEKFVVKDKEKQHFKQKSEIGLKAMILHNNPLLGVLHFFFIPSTKYSVCKNQVA